MIGEEISDAALVVAIHFGQLIRNRAIMLHRLEPYLPVVAALQKSGQRVVIGRGDGIEFVIVTSGACHRDSQKRLRHHIDHVVETIGFVFPNIDRRMDPLTEKPEAGTQHRFVELATG